MVGSSRLQQGAADTDIGFNGCQKDKSVIRKQNIFRINYHRC